MGHGLNGNGHSGQGSKDYLLERREYRRYLVNGKVQLWASMGEGSGELANIGIGGLLARSSIMPPRGEILKISFTVIDYPATYEAVGQVVGNLDVLSIMFEEEPIGLRELLRWLDRENYIWPGIGTKESFLSNGSDGYPTPHRLSQTTQEQAALDQRGNPRHRYEGVANCEYSGTTVQMIVTNISRSGILLSGPKLMPVGALANMHLFPGEAREIELGGVVRHIVNGSGVESVDVLPEFQARLNAYLDEIAANSASNPLPWEEGFWID